MDHDYDNELEARCPECETPFIIQSSFNNEVAYCPFCGADIFIEDDDEDTEPLDFEDD